MSMQPNRALALLIQELLELPDLRSATRILRAALGSIAAALQRGESVYIKGFGNFKVVERTHRPTPNSIIASKGHRRPVAFSTEMQHYSPRRVVIFEPSISLMARLNVSSPNYKERRIQQRWSTPNEAPPCE